MKHLFLSVFLIYSGYTGIAQSTTKYCELIVYTPNVKYFARVSYSDSAGIKPQLIKDSAGNKMKFSSPMEALNYITKDGWELVAVGQVHSDNARFYLKKHT